MTAGVSATVLDVYMNRAVNVGTGSPGPIQSVRVDYQYFANGKPYKRTVIMSSNAGKEFKVGVPAKVCFNPDDAGEAELVNLNRTCGK